MFVFFSTFSSGRLIEAFVLPRIVQNIAIFSVQIGGWAFIRAWASIRDFTVFWGCEEESSSVYSAGLLHNVQLKDSKICICIPSYRDNIIKHTPLQFIPPHTHVEWGFERAPAYIILLFLL